MTQVSTNSVVDGGVDYRAASTDMDDANNLFGRSTRRGTRAMKKYGVQEDNELTSSGLVSGTNQAADPSRRRFVKLNLLGLALAPIASLQVGENAWASRTARIETDHTPAVLDPADPQAQALSYSAQSPKEGQSCSNCQLYTGTEGEESGPCAIFSYRVAPNGKQLLADATGWCRSWGPRQPA
jgi:hypothetical protein